MHIKDEMLNGIERNSIFLTDLTVNLLECRFSINIEHLYIGKPSEEFECTLQYKVIFSGKLMDLFCLSDYDFE